MDLEIQEEGIDSRSLGGSRPLPLGEMELVSAGQVGINCGHLRAILRRVCGRPRAWGGDSVVGSDTTIFEA